MTLDVEMKLKISSKLFDKKLLNKDGILLFATHNEVSKNGILCTDLTRNKKKYGTAVHSILKMLQPGQCHHHLSESILLVQEFCTVFVVTL